MKVKKLKRTVYKLLSTLYDKSLAPPTDREKELIEELRGAFSRFPSSKPKNRLLSENEWLQNVNRLRELVLNNNPREFLRWDLILRTMVVTHASYIGPELKYLKSLPDWSNRWTEAIKESSVGHPVPHWQYPDSSATLIHHAYHWARFEEKTAIRANGIKCVLEFGGGYGSMCRLLHNLGFQGKYILLDLREFSALQEFFLKSVGVDIHELDSFMTAKSGIVCISDLQELYAILSNHIEVSDSMFIATWSISETPLSLRNAILPLVSSFKAFLIAYQDCFGEVDNIDFFGNWRETQKDIEWYDWKIENVPNSRYLVGKRKTS